MREDIEQDPNVGDHSTACAYRQLEAALQCPRLRLELARYIIRHRCFAERGISMVPVYPAAFPLFHTIITHS